MCSQDVVCSSTSASRYACAKRNVLCTRFHLSASSSSVDAKHATTAANSRWNEYRPVNYLLQSSMKQLFCSTVLNGFLSAPRVISSLIDCLSTRAQELQIVRVHKYLTHDVTDSANFEAGISCFQSKHVRFVITRGEIADIGAQNNKIMTELTQQWQDMSISKCFNSAIAFHQLMKKHLAKDIDRQQLYDFVGA